MLSDYKQCVNKVGNLIPRAVPSIPNETEDTACSFNYLKLLHLINAFQLHALNAENLLKKPALKSVVTC